ncbi:salicylate hydroxylase [Mollisia scopiformis]|uniref:Salicylate hydroxylase n=1 Tax=Mollisia scopiformis TaxID=149040 RepID=A0A194XHH4_MOLSC|nr:salicylate hydroxylase [Mollisia scopiformis]KUJ19579.1 salicylate hydroxylase [Mollisia scopiformis]
MSPVGPAQLKIIIIGAGIAGLSAAITCRRAGHLVEVYERSSLNNEIGAAIHIPPNASRGLLAWGFDTERAKLVTCKRSYRAHGTSLKTFHKTDESYMESTFGAPWLLAHRVDLHEELKRLATGSDGEGKPAVAYLKSEVISYDYEAGSVTLASGRSITGDLVVAADGVHTSAVEAILGTSNPALPTTGYNFAYRFLIPAKALDSDPETEWFGKGENGCMKFFVEEGIRLVSYPCRNKEEHNFVAIFHSDVIGSREDWQTSVDKSALLDRYSSFHPSLLAVLNKATDIKQWPLLFRAPIPSWHKGKLVLLGDAAHPMLPHQGQGGAQGIEDAVALGMVLTNCTLDTLGERIGIFEDIRIKRASVIQIFSNAGQDEPEKIRRDAAKFIPADTVPKTPEEFHKFNFGYDVVRHSTQSIEERYPEWVLPKKFFEHEPRRGVYP